MVVRGGPPPRPGINSKGGDHRQDMVSTVEGGGHRQDLVSTDEGGGGGECDLAWSGINRKGRGWYDCY
jgi:hypothetical protein